MQNNILIIAKAQINKGVFSSHVEGLSKSLQVNNKKIGILSINSKKSIKKLSEKKYLELNNFLELGWEIYSSLFILNPRFYFKILKNIKNNKIDILYCQNYLPSFLGVILKAFNRDIKVHADIKGIVPEEHLLYDRGIKKYLIYILSKIFEFFIFKYADSYSVVSEKFKEYFEEKYNINKKTIIVLPSSLNSDIFYFSDEIRSKKRNELGWDDKKILIYSGSMVEWQLPEKLLTTMNNLANSTSNVLPIVLTLEKDKAEKIKAELNLKNLIIVSASSSIEVNEYLNASDIAITIRKNDIVNNVSSPTKIAEYLYTRNKVILSEGIGDYSDLSEKYSGIYKISDIENINIDEISSFIQSKTEIDTKITQLIENEYTLEANIKKINSLFNK